MQAFFKIKFVRSVGIGPTPHGLKVRCSKPTELRAHLDISIIIEYRNYLNSILVGQVGIEPTQPMALVLRTSLTLQR